jgi:hypothetical protein
MTLRKFHNILYFNIFRFHCFCTGWLTKPRYSFLELNGLNGVSDRRRENDSCDGDFQSWVSLGLTDRFMGTLEGSVILTLWNLIGALLRLDLHSWKYGIYFCLVVGVLSIFAFNHEYVDDFKEFKSWSGNESRKFVIITLLTVIGILSALISSFALYASIAFNNSK